MRNNEMFSNPNQKSAVAVLTKGYESLEEYQQLIDRNQSIFTNFYSLLPKDHDIEVVIYHEGNITSEHQDYIQKHTDQMPLIFEVIPFLQPTIEPNSFCHSTDLSDNFSMGYKNMCRFWSIGIFEHMTKYEYIIRIDEDCVLEKLDPNVLTKYRTKNIMFSSPMWVGEDTDSVTIGMHKFFQDYKTDIPKEVPNPYTNIMIVNVQYFAKHQDIQNCLTDIDKTNCIFINRWGDIPIWGYLLAAFITDKSIILDDKKITYFHGSHHTKVN